MRTAACRPIALAPTPNTWSSLPPGGPANDNQTDGFRPSHRNVGKMAAGLAAVTLSFVGLAQAATPGDPPPANDNGTSLTLPFLDQALPQPPAAVVTAVDKAKAVGSTVKSVKDFLHKKRALKQWETTSTDADGVDHEQRFDILSGGLDVVDHFGTAGGLSSPEVRFENGAVLNAELVGGRRQSTYTTDNGNVTTGVEAGINTHDEYIYHSDFGVGHTLDAADASDNGLHLVENVVAQMQAYKAITYQLSDGSSIEAKGALGVADTLYARSTGTNPLTTTGGDLATLVNGGYGPTGSAEVSYQRDISNRFRWIGDNATFRGVFKDSVYYNVPGHQFVYSYRVGGVVDKKLDVHAFGKKHNVTLTVGLYADKEPNASIAFKPEVGMKVNF